MPPITLPLSKPSDGAKLKLSLKKSPSYRVRLAWDCNTDLDLHALVATNYGQGGKISELDDILSTYNVRRIVNGQPEGFIVPNPDKTFSVRNGALTHSPDATDGAVSDGDDEWLRVKPDALTLPAGAAIEIPLIAMIHKPNGKTFRNVQNARVVVDDAEGEELLVVNLSADFAGNTGVQMGTIIIDANGSSFAPVGVGFTGDFNSVLEHFM